MAKVAKKKAAKKKAPKGKPFPGKGLVAINAKNEVFYFPPGTLVRHIVSAELVEAAIAYASEVKAADRITGGYFFTLNRMGPRGGMDDLSEITSPTVIDPKKK